MAISSKDLEAVWRMYNALMSIGCVTSGHFAAGPVGALAQVKRIANSCLKEMNVEHTQLIAEAIGLEDKR